MPEALEFSVYGLSGGINVKAVPQMVGDNDLVTAYNIYLRPDGGAQQRNGMTQFGPAVAGSGWIQGLARFYQDVNNGAAISPETVMQLVQCGGNLYHLTSVASTLIGSVGGTNANPMTWVRAQDPNDPNFTSGLTDVAVICTGNGGPYVYDGTNLYVPAGWSAAAGASWVAIVNGIIWFGGIDTTPNQIFGSGDGITASMETLPGYRNFVFSSATQGIGAAGTGSTAVLVVGLNDGIAVLSGTGPSTFYLQEVPFEDAVTAGRTMISVNGVNYFLGHNAEYTFDQTTPPTQISQKVEPWILNDPYAPGFPMNGERELSWSCVYNNRLHIGYGSGQAAPNTILVYDLVLQGWTVLQTTPGISAMCLLDAPSDPNPYGALVGSSTTPYVYTWDVAPVGGVPATDNGAYIYAYCQTKFFKIGAPGTNKAMQRFYPEIFYTGTLSLQAQLFTDYGLGSINSAINIPVFNSSVWDFAIWDESRWAGGGFTSYGPPNSRIDYPGTQGESFSFGVATIAPSAPWTFAGGSGAVNQRGRT